MHWGTRSPFAPHLASLGLGEVAQGIDAAMLVAQEFKQATGQQHYVITLADARLYSRPEHYTFDNAYYPGWAVINALGESKLPAHVTTHWWPGGASNPDDQSSSGSGAPRTVLPPAGSSSSGSLLGDGAFKTFAVIGGVVAGSLAAWWILK